MDLKELLAEQVAAAQKVIATSTAIKERLAAQGIDIDLPLPPGAQAKKPGGNGRGPRPGNDLETPLLADNEGDPEQGGAGAASAAAKGAHRSEAAKMLRGLVGRLKGEKFSSAPPKVQAGEFDSDDAAAATRTTSRGMFGVFPSKEAVKNSLLKPAYNVEDFYYTEGICQKIAKNATFSNLTFVVIFLNAIWIGISTDGNKVEVDGKMTTPLVLSESPWWIQVGENLFCLFFTFELSVRFLSFANKCNCGRDGWFVFDSILVALMVHETWIEVFLVAVIGNDATGHGAGHATVLRILRLSRLTRLTRVTRLARILRNVPELLILTKAMLLAIRSMGTMLVLLSIGIYVFAIFFVQMLASEPEGKGMFETVPMGMHTLLVNGILTEHKSIVNDMLEKGILYYIVILFYILIVALTMTDMLIGVICEVVERVAEVETEALIKNDLEVKIMSIREAAGDRDEGKTLSKEQFAHILENREENRKLTDIGVDIVSLADYTEVLFLDHDEVDVEEFIEVVLGFRQQDNAMKQQFEMKSFIKGELNKCFKRLKDPAALQHSPR